MESGEQNREISLLRHENGELQPKKKRIVHFNGNAEFVKVLAIKKTREQMLKITQPAEPQIGSSN
jgi:hypothetical protein